MIELLRIPEGYNEDNIYNFPSTDARDRFFDKYVIKTIEDSYYPPYYRNTINLSTDDFDIYGKSFNYVRISTGLQHYYYFVRDIQYINQTLYKTYLEMDTITTYLFDIELSDVCIARKFIDRYNADGTINRNYLRENVSTAIMKQIQREYLTTTTSSDQTKGLIIIKLSDTPYKKGNTDYCKFQTIRYLSRFEFVPQNGYYCILPFNDAILTANEFQIIAKYGSGNVDGDIGKFSFFMTLKELSKAVKVTEMYIIPGNPLKNYIFTQGNTIYYHTAADTKRPIDKCTNQDCDIFNNQNSACFLLTDFTIIPNTFEFRKSIGFTIQNKKETAFNKMFVPCLLDSNYYRISFGERNYQTTDLLEYANKDVFTLTYQGMIDGTRFYFVGSDTYYTSVLADNKYLMTLYTSEWNNYNAYNKASIGMAIGNYALSCFGFGYGTNSSLKSTYGGNQPLIDTIYSTPMYLDKRHKSPTLNTKGAALMDYITPGESNAMRNSKVSATNKAIGEASSLVHTATQEYNAWFAPNSVRSSYDLDNAFVSRCDDLVYVLYQVEDIEQVAQYYHRNGYLVNEYYNEPSMLFSLIDYVRNRYYFNILKLATCNVDFLTCTTGEDIKEDIEYRLNMGIRIWNYEVNDIGNYSYDNVERKYING